jgi:hypothetical protein
MLDRNEISKRFIEIVAHNLDVKDQLSEGVVNIDHMRWLTRYSGEYSPDNTGVICNTFRPEVCQIVSQLMCAIDSPKTAMDEMQSQAMPLSFTSGRKFTKEEIEKITSRPSAPFVINKIKSVEGDL